ncbi:guanine nucleotide exchange factor DBS-like isoform X3 [Artemia franciscana]|uniref:guanine nucleotide exchange factor DBS-like isoform X3 n=1 Tax=Artemia franciscana TaxID=6661 RepID=UPI0032D9B26B
MVPVFLLSLCHLNNEKQDCSCTCHKVDSQNETMDDLNCSVSIQEVGNLLKSQYAYFSGGRSRDHCALITFPDRSHATGNITDEDYRKLIIYLTSVAPLQDADLGFVLIIDRRNDKWNAVKSSLLRISNFFPGLISAAYVLRPSGLLQKAISEVSSKLFREDFKFKVVICSCLEDLHNHVDPTQLSSEFGGSLKYNHEEWIDVRMSIEKFSDNVSEMSTSLKKFSRRLNESEVPNEVTTIEFLLLNQSNDYSQLKEEIGKIKRQGESLQEQIKDSGNESSRNLELSPSQKINLVTVERYLNETKELDISLDTVWRGHEGQLHQVLLLRRFEMDIKELQPQFADILRQLSSMKDNGDSLSDILELIDECEAFKSSCQDCLHRSHELWKAGHQLLTEYSNVDSVQVSVKPKTKELENMKTQCETNFDKRFETLEKAKILFEKIEKVNKWCAAGVELLASQPLEKYGTIEHAEAGINDIEVFLRTSNDIERLETYLQELTAPESRALILQVLKRVEDVQVMCSRRRSSLKKIISRPPKPIQPVTPEPAVPVNAVKPQELIRPRLRSASRQEMTSSVDSLTNTDTEALKVKRGHILTELLETERIYVSEIGVILRGYKDELISLENQQKIPLTLLGKEEVLFGNLEQIHDFHSNIFLPDLEHFIEDPQMISQCFLRRKNELHELYSYYCQNIPQSEELRRAAGEQNSFLRECQLRLGHKLPLGAYLLKPVQRITKYQLLLRDLLKCGTGPNSSGNLQSALDSMLAVLRTVNDSMHQVAISGYQGSLVDLGRLLLQGSFNVWTEGKRDRLRDLRLKPMQRHIFLYEKAVLMCKRVGKDPEKATYQYKHSLNMSEVGLTEKVHSGRSSDGKRFELWLQGRQEVWLLQASAVDVKETWVCEIKRVLLSQFQRLKCQTGRNPPGRYVANTSRHSTPIMSPNTISPTATHRTVRSTASWEYCNSSSSSGLGSERSSVSCSTQSGDRTSRDTPSIQTYSNEEEEGWSTDFSLSDDDDDNTPRCKDSISARRYLALADYAPLGPAEVKMQEGDLVELLRIGSAGWWYVRVPGQNSQISEGWVPSSYLEVQPTARRSPGGSTGTPSLLSQESGIEKDSKDMQVFIEPSMV